MPWDAYHSSQLSWTLAKNPSWGKPSQAAKTNNESPGKLEAVGALSLSTSKTTHAERKPTANLSIRSFSKIWIKNNNKIKHTIIYFSLKKSDWKYFNLLSLSFPIKMKWSEVPFYYLPFSSTIPVDAPPPLLSLPLEVSHYSRVIYWLSSFFVASYILSLFLFIDDVYLSFLWKILKEAGGAAFLIHCHFIFIEIPSVIKEKKEGMSVLSIWVQFRISSHVVVKNDDVFWVEIGVYWSAVRIELKWIQVNEATELSHFVTFLLITIKN